MSRTARSILLSLAVACAAPRAGAQERAQAEVASSSLPRARLQLDYRISLRADDQSLDRLSISAKGVAPANVRLSGAAYFTDSLGLAADLAYEPYALSGNDLAGRGVVLRVTGLRLAAGLAARASLGGGAAIEGVLGYGYAQLPALEASGDTLQARRAVAHGPELALIAGLRRGWLAPSLKVRATPYAMATLGESRMTGYEAAAGAQLGLGSARWGSSEWQLAAHYEYALERLSGGTAVLRQGAHQMGLGLSASFPGRSPAFIDPSLIPGSVRGLVRVGGAPAGPGVVVQAVGLGSAQTDDAGAFAFRSPPGPLTLRAELAGAAPAEKTVAVAPGAEVEVELDLALALASGPGRILGEVVDGEAPLAGVEVAAPGLPPVRTGDDGAFEIPSAGPGPVPLRLTLPGYAPAEEVIAVPPAGAASVKLALRKAASRAMATLRGLVRTRAGKPLAARLRVLEADLATTATAGGEFSVKLPGGRYRVTIEMPGYISQAKLVEVADGDQAIFNIDLHPVP